jgi:hypothetical protein
MEDEKIYRLGHSNLDRRYLYSVKFERNDGGTNAWDLEIESINVIAENVLDAIDKTKDREFFQDSKSSQYYPHYCRIIEVTREMVVDIG